MSLQGVQIERPSMKERAIKGLNNHAEVEAFRNGVDAIGTQESGSSHPCVQVRGEAMCERSWVGGVVS